MNPSKTIKYLLLTAVASLAACSNIPDDERLVYIAPASAERNVLIEDFTGQRCVNCPKATDAIHEIQEVYGENVIAVAIHCGSFGYKGNAKNIGLLTDAGTEYWNHWFSATQGQPVAKINRGEKTESYNDWSANVAAALAVPTDVSLAVETSFDADSRQLSIATTALAPAGRKAKLQLWLVEDGIVAMQSLPDGSSNRDYVHNHVLRDAINGVWGEDITFAETPLQFNHTYTLPAAYGAEGTLLSDCVPANCSVVAFVYDDQGVEQVVKVKVTE